MVRERARGDAWQRAGHEPAVAQYNGGAVLDPLDEPGLRLRGGDRDLEAPDAARPDEPMTSRLAGAMAPVVPASTTSPPRPSSTIRVIPAAASSRRARAAAAARSPRRTAAMKSASAPTRRSARNASLRDSS